MGGLRLEYFCLKQSGLKTKCSSSVAIILPSTPQAGHTGFLHR